jgi:hydroxypyruvate isomerase
VHSAWSIGARFGEVNYPFVFSRIGELGYRSWIGCEYKSVAATKAGFSWLRPCLAEKAA